MYLDKTLLFLIRKPNDVEKNKRLQVIIFLQMTSNEDIQYFSEKSRFF